MLPEIDATDDRLSMRGIIELLIAKIEAQVDGTIKVYFRLDLQATLRQTMGDTAAWGLSGKGLLIGGFAPISPIS